MQRFAYILAANEHGPDPPDQEPSQFKEAQDFRQSTSKIR